jgi:hypothetical protein
MKKIIPVLVIMILLALIISLNLYSGSIDLDRLNFVHRWTARQVNNSWQNYIRSIPKDARAIVDFDTLMNQLNFYERNFAERIFEINPKDNPYGASFEPWHWHLERVNN